MADRRLVSTVEIDATQAEAARRKLARNVCTDRQE